MRDFDFTPLMRSMIGFDRIKQLLENPLDGEQASNYPPHDIERSDENAWRITMAVAGFSPDELSVVQKQNELVVAGSKRGDGMGRYLYRGIATRSFERRFDLADYVEVKEARLADGLLVIELVRELPEEMRPRRIAIAGGAPTAVESTEQPRLHQAA